MRFITFTPSMFFFFFSSMPGTLSGVTAAAIPNPEPVAVDGNVATSGMESRNYTDPLYGV